MRCGDCWDDFSKFHLAPEGTELRIRHLAAEDDEFGENAMIFMAGYGWKNAINIYCRICGDFFLLVDLRFTFVRFL